MEEIVFKISGTVLRKLLWQLLDSMLFAGIY